ncbi:MAG: hypothetical protein ACRDNR_12740 [Gaiellaceae bacterium]
MGWLNKLLGREEKAPEAPAAPATPEAPFEPEPQPSDVAQAEERVAAERESLESENRTPPGTG